MNQAISSNSTARSLATLLLFAWVLCCGTPSFGQQIESFLEPNQEVELSAAEFGPVTELHVEEGQWVKAGDLIAELDARELEAGLQIARAAASAEGQIKAALAELKIQRERQRIIEGLLERNHASSEEARQAELEVELAESRLEIARDELQQRALEVERLHAQIQRRRCWAPFDGVVADTYREPGEFVTAGDPRLIRLLQLHPLRAKFSVPETVAAQVKVGEQVSIELNDGEVISGVVQYVAPFLDGQTGTIRTTVQIPNERLQLTAGSACRLVLNPTNRRHVSSDVSVKP